MKKFLYLFFLLVSCSQSDQRNMDVQAFSSAVPEEKQWEQTDAWKIVDYETHKDSDNLIDGIYRDWTGLPKPWNESLGWPTTYNYGQRYTSSWDNSQRRSGVAVWAIQVDRTGWYDIRATYKRTENRAPDAQYYVYTNITVEDIENNTVGDPIIHRVVDQHGPNSEAGLWHYAEVGVVCLNEGDVSVLVLDARKTVRSVSADAAFWTYLGNEYGGEKCPDVSFPLSIINYLLLSSKEQGTDPSDQSDKEIPMPE